MTVSFACHPHIQREPAELFDLARNVDTMSSRITQCHFPDSFTDEQVRGPFRFFRHLHEFIPDDGGTLMIDRVEFAARFGVVGRLAEKAVLGRYLRNLIGQRNRYLAGSGAAA
ncbi:SRPBCC family protein [Arthrobacter sp. MA-N2]|uniref:SRPBCC family protein n=1 Tax=Arthrobacter sp. MA-N2 TaxID=1101188 RepID=UPI0006878FD4|nr:SRPBCC family protein [Arthrobacter sp. MA-N2]